ncbi:MAG: serine--tRNA ligase [Candidatus Pacebacteria bacterium]|nr:serine--tRNA ligase [Candidatus Paceibacterota bacterium]
MLDIKFIKENADQIKKAARDKKIDIDIDRLLSVNEERVRLITEIQEIKTEQNKFSKAKPDLATIESLKILKSKIATLREKLDSIEEDYLDLMIKVPTIPSTDVPFGKDDSENVEVFKWGEPTKFDFEPKSHIELAEDLDLIDFTRGSKVAGYRGYYVKNEAVMLQMGLMMYALDKLVKKGFTPVIPPTLVKEFVLFGSGYFSSRKYNPEIDEVYKIENEQDKNADGTLSKESKFLVGTAEPSILAYYSDEVLEKKNLPMKICGFSQCYRSEIGSYGKNTKGIYRVHEFMKIEQVGITSANIEEAEKVHQELRAVAKEIHEDLKIPYRELIICTGDLSAGKYKQYDIEAWIPSMNGYGETGSASNFLDWQSRRLNVKYRDKDTTNYVYMLNSTAIPSPRMLIAIMENYQQKDGTILVPEVLKQYVGKDIIGKKNE